MDLATDLKRGIGWSPSPSRGVSRNRANVPAENGSTAALFNGINGGGLLIASACGTMNHHSEYGVGISVLPVQTRKGKLLRAVNANAPIHAIAYLQSAPATRLRRSRRI